MTKGKLKKFDLITHFFYPLTVILMESLWISLWLKWIGSRTIFQEPRQVLSLTSVIIVIAAAMLITRIFINQKFSLLGTQFCIIISGIITMTVVLGIEYSGNYILLSFQWFKYIIELFKNTFAHPGTIIIAIPAIIYLWWRGIILGKSSSASWFEKIYTSFVFAITALIILLIFWQLTGASGTKNNLPGQEICIYILTFFFSGLLSVAISHFYIIHSAVPKKEVIISSVRRYFLLMLIAISCIIFVSFVIASIISPELIEGAGRITHAVIEFIGNILSYVLIALVYLVGAIFAIFKWFLGLFFTDRMPAQEHRNIKLPEFNYHYKSIGPSSIMIDIIEWLVLATIVVLVIFFLAKAIKRYRERNAMETEDIDEVRVSLGSWSSFMTDLRLLLKSLGQKFKQKTHKATSYLFNINKAGILDIREMFRHLQYEAARSGIARRRHETVEEYARRIEKKIPGSRIHLNNFIKIYENVRYGGYIIHTDLLSHANELWQTLRGLLRDLRKE